MTERLEEHAARHLSDRVDAEINSEFREGATQAQDGGADVVHRAVERLRSIEGLREESWRKLDEHGRRAMLNAAGREVAEVLRHPAPPLHLEDMQSPEYRGSYGDGFRSGPDGVLEGSDYRISMNRQAYTPEEGVLGDDPRAALDTYLHEFRHGYQHEQAARFEKPQFQNLVDNPELAEQWSSNFRNYKSPEVDLESYLNQPVESDARDFANQITSRLFLESDDQS